LARYIQLPSFLSTKRSRVITVAAAGTLTLVAAISAAAVTLPATFPVSASVRAADLNLDSMSHSVASAQSAAGSSSQQSMLSDVATEKAAAAVNARRAAAAASEAAQAAAARKAAVQAVAAAERAAAQRAQAQAAAQAQASQQAQASAQAQPTQQSQGATQRSQTTVHAAPVAAGSAQQVAEQMLSQFGWSSSQFACLEPLWAQESGWSVTAENPSSGAYGIPQALPGSKMASAGSDWQTNAATQIRWGLTYIQGLYGTPCGAWAHEQADGWY
jgi:hypothetical protein